MTTDCQLSIVLGTNLKYLMDNVCNCKRTKNENVDIEVIQMPHYFSPPL